MTTQQPIFRTSAEAVRLKRKLAEVPQGETVTYSEIRALIGVDPQSDRGRGICATAIKQTQKESLAVFQCVKGVGFKHLTDEEIPDVGSAIIRHIGRKARQGAHTTTCAEPSKLSPARRIQQLSLQTRFAVLASTTSTKAEKQIESAVEKAQAVLDCSAATLAMFK